MEFERFKRNILYQCEPQISIQKNGFINIGMGVFREFNIDKSIKNCNLFFDKETKRIGIQIIESGEWKVFHFKGFRRAINVKSFTNHYGILSSQLKIPCRLYEQNFIISEPVKVMEKGGDNPSNGTGNPSGKG